MGDAKAKLYVHLDSQTDMSPVVRVRILIVL